MDNIINLELNNDFQKGEREFELMYGYTEELRQEVTNNINALNDEQLKVLNKIATQIQKDGTYTIIGDDYKPRDKRRFFKMYIKEVNEAIFNCKSINEIKILLFMLDKMNYDTGEIIVPNLMITEQLNLDKATVSKSIKGLLENEIIKIKEGYENKRVKIYLPNEKYFKYGR
ncbi:hypothetical protein [Fusobacterium sp.]|uniref:hypothetical protein n=1 Tax=Fusobacterium sp. TaxID=68766 RepID=UPI00260E1C23|nr:hypothetical protein [Fusobacterium sp.]EGT0001085.1 MarR family transcriptional regulator [Clostridium perfringens]MDK0731005.1 hypothetical protein [Clostridium perfringens]MDM0612798.1 hypothetical protein [Clostridium perfringens]